MFTEESFENVIIEYLQELNYDYTHGSNLEFNTIAKLT